MNIGKGKSQFQKKGHAGKAVSQLQLYKFLLIGNTALCTTVGKSNLLGTLLLGQYVATPRLGGKLLGLATNRFEQP